MTTQAFTDPETYAIIGAAMEVHRELGCGYLEAVYRRALEIEFENRQIAFTNEVNIPIRYKAQSLALGYRADFVCFDTILVEIKALDGLGPVEQAQVLNYLKGAGLKRGLLLNLGQTSLQCRRLVRGLPRAEDPRAKE
jgi:GxxExxY protein